MFDPDAPDPLDRPGPRPWSERTLQERIGFLLAFGAIAGSIALIVIADTPVFRFGVASVAMIAAAWFVLRAWIGGTKAAHRLREGRPIAAVFGAIVVAIEIGASGLILWYAAQFVLV